MSASNEMDIDLSKSGITSLVIGNVMLISAEEEFAKGFDEKYGEKGFMFFVHAPKDLRTGEGEKAGVASLNILRIFE